MNKVTYKLKWRTNGETFHYAECGVMQATVDLDGTGRTYRLEISTDPVKTNGPWALVHAVDGIRSSDNAREMAEIWFHQQIRQMVKALGL